jgi:hypothetical protein
VKCPGSRQDGHPLGGSRRGRRADSSAELVRARCGLAVGHPPAEWATRPWRISMFRLWYPAAPAPSSSHERERFLVNESLRGIRRVGGYWPLLRDAPSARSARCGTTIARHMFTLNTDWVGSGSWGTAVPQPAITLQAEGRPEIEVPASGKRCQRDTTLPGDGLLQSPSPRPGINRRLDADQALL